MRPPQAPVWGSNA